MSRQQLGQNSGLGQRSQEELLLPSPDGNSATKLESLERAEEVIALSRWVATQLEDRVMKNDPKRVLSDEQVSQLVEPITTRIRAGLLQESQSFVITLAHGIACGGLPLKLFVQDPLIDLSTSDVTKINDGRWLLPHLQERKVSLPLEEPTKENPDPHFTSQHHRIISAAQECLKKTNPEMPVFFLGSAAAYPEKIANDLDIGTSSALRPLFTKNNEDFKYDFDLFSHKLCRKYEEMKRERKFISAHPKHVGAVWEFIPLAVGVSVHRHGRAIRMTASDIFIIEAKDNNPS